MELIDAASFFDNDEIFDGYTGEFLFLGHTTPHDDHTSSGATVRRRTLTAAPDTVSPPRRVIQLNGEYWVVGNSNPDSFQGEVVRRSYGLKKSSGLTQLLSPAQACRGVAGIELHAHRDYYRDTVDTQTSSDWDTMWNIYCPLSEPVGKGMVFKLGDELMRVRNVYVSVDEYRVAEADQLEPDTLQPIVFIKKAKPDLVNGTRAPELIETTGLQMEMPKNYVYRDQAEAGAKPGDRAVLVPKDAVTPKVGAAFTMQGVEWRVMSVVPERDAWWIHARSAGPA